MCIPKRQHGKQAVQHKRSLLPICFAVCVPFVCCLCNTGAVCFPFVYTFTPHEPNRGGKADGARGCPETRVRGISSVAEEENTFFCYRLLINN